MSTDQTNGNEQVDRRTELPKEGDDGKRPSTGQGKPEVEVIKKAGTSAPYRMKMSHQNEFTPKAIVFVTSSLTPEDDQKSWTECLDTKAAAVFFAIFERRTNDTTLVPAKDFLNDIAVKCFERIADSKTKPKDEDVNLIKDAIYLAVGFLHDINQHFSNDRENLDKYCMSKHGAQVLSDIAMINNQLDLDLINNVVEALRKVRMSEVPSFSRFKDRYSLINKGEQPFEKLDNIQELVSVFCWYYSPFLYAADSSSSKRFQYSKTSLLERLHQSTVQSVKCNNGKISANVWLPTAKELKRSGVRFAAVTDSKFNVEFQAPTLKLPVLFWDSKLETVVMNLVALESFQPNRPVTRYFQLLNELVDDEEDVRVLSKCGVLKGRWKKEEVVVSFMRRVDGFASYPSMCPAIDVQMEEVKKYIDKRKKKFLVRFGPANSWVPYVAAAATVVVTAVVAARRRASSN